MMALSLQDCEGSLEKRSLQRRSHSLCREVLDCNARVVVIEPQTAGAIAVIAGGIGRTIGCGIIQCLIERRLRIHDCRGDTAVLGLEASEICRDQVVVLCDHCRFRGSGTGALRKHEWRAVDCCKVLESIGDIKQKQDLRGTPRST